MFGSSSGVPLLAPRHCLITVEHQRSPCAPLLDQLLLEGAVALGRERLLGMEGVEPGAPTATDHTVVPLDEPRECVPRRRAAHVPRSGRGRWRHAVPAAGYRGGPARPGRNQNVRLARDLRALQADPRRAGLRPPSEPSVSRRTQASFVNTGAPWSCVASTRVEARVRTGGCLCGAVRYSLRGDPMHVRRCHCANCRKESGSAFTVYAHWPVEAFEMSGEISSYDGRGFCPRCGSRLLDTSNPGDTFVEIRIGSFEDRPFELKPADEIWVKRRESWI